MSEPKTVAVDEIQTACLRVRDCLAFAQFAVEDGRAGRIDAAYRKLKRLHVVYHQPALLKHVARWLEANSDRSVEHNGAFWTTSHDAALETARKILFELYVFHLAEWHEPSNPKVL